MDSNEQHQEFKGSSFVVALRTSLVFIVLCGILYPLVCTGIAQWVMPAQANGSLIKDASGKVVGSELIGQNFTDPKTFQGRVSSIENNGAGSGSNNYAPSNPDLLKRTQESINAWKIANPGVPVSQLPIALITNSGSGLDPHITPQSAEVQIPRISKLTGVPQEELLELVKKHTESRDLGVFGEPRVNVLKVNIDLKTMLK
ncbi:potassium-transporting ATPase subunit C [Paenibacillus swuensis]|uniref:Potassium-transporting ATPase KdpC subunit n=1 Tax=Paenibacillus swuensis TaxID=1178515 RepID=A0A172TJH1_9BACL|nr:potassium-transporting ATPase subunit KdpC [Paenibacillus swuensis]ANE46943.1 potassium-transporting ATPase subunit C [Paenibacillus swuensis]